MYQLSPRNLQRRTCLLSPLLLRPFDCAAVGMQRYLIRYIDFWSNSLPFTPQTTDANVCIKKSQSSGGAIFFNRGLYHLEKKVLKWTSYMLPLASKTTFTDLYGKPSRAPTLPLIDWLCRFNLQCKVRIWYYNFAVQMNPWIPNFLLIEISSQKSRVGACKVRTRARPRFLSVVCAPLRETRRELLVRAQIIKV